MWMYRGRGNFEFSQSCQIVAAVYNIFGAGIDSEALNPFAAEERTSASGGTMEYVRNAKKKRAAQQAAEKQKARNSR